MAAIDLKSRRALTAMRSVERATQGASHAVTRTLAAVRCVGGAFPESDVSGRLDNSPSVK